MYHELLKRCVELSKEKGRTRGLPDLSHPTDFLRVSDRSFLPDAWPPEAESDKIAGDIVSMLTRRDLYKRALIISRLFLPDIDRDEEAKSGFERLLACGTNRSDRDALRDKIVERAKELMSFKAHKEATKELRRRFSALSVLIDIPRSPTVEETHAVMIPVSSERRAADERVVPLSEVFPIEK